MLPLTMQALVPRIGTEMTALARALGVKRADLMKRLRELGGGRRRLGDLGADRKLIDDAVKGMLARQELRLTPDVPDERELRELIETAW
jgi:alcohol dehydrogenase class IV